MRKKSFYKDLKRSLSSSKARFLSIMAMIALGVGFFAGINATEPDMVLSADQYFKDQNLSNFRIMSPLGFESEDLAKIRSVPETDVIMESYTKDVFLSSEESTYITKLYSYNEEDLDQGTYLNQPRIEEGRMPKTSGEIVLESKVRDLPGIKLGDTITLSLPNADDWKDSFKTKTYTVTGFITMPYYISFERGQTNIGDGSIDYYGMILKQDFAMEDITDLFIKTKNSDEIQAYSDEYKTYHSPMEDKFDEFGEYAMDRETKDLRKKLQEGEDELQEEKTKAEKEIADAQQELVDAEKKLTDGEIELEDNIIKYKKEFKEKRQEIKDGKLALEKGKADYFVGYTTWLEGYNEYQDGMTELNASKAQLEAAKIQLDQGERELSAAKTQLDQGREQITLLENVLVGLKGIQTSLPEGTELTKEEYLEIIQNIKVLSPEIGKIIEESIPFADPNLTASIRAALEGGILELGLNLESAKVSYENGLRDYENGQALLVKNRANYEAGLKAYQSGEKVLAESKIKIDEGKATLDAANQEIQENEVKLLDGEKTLDKGEEEFFATVEETKIELADGRVELEDGKATFTKEKAKAEKEIAEAEKEIKDAERLIKELPSNWFISPREAFPGYATLGDDARRIGSVAKVFPLFFFLVAALVCLTTMTRMVEEERIQIGTLKALGYKTSTISLKYLMYALLASFIGSVIGFLAGFQIFPRAIITVYQAMYETPYVLAPFHWDLALISTAIAVVTTVSASLFATVNELRETPAILMQPKAPKPGKRIFLERIKPLWSRLSFSYKVTFRNIFRYKKRFLMTVIGISGCSALLVTGFGISDSVNAIMNEQFEEIFIYDGMVVLNEESEPSQKNLDKILGENPDVKNFMSVHNESVTLLKSGSSREYEVNLIIPEDVKKFRNFYDLHERVGNEEVPLTNEGAVLTEKVAELLDVKVGDTLKYQDTENRIYEFMISGITENYLAHYIYMTEEYFDSITLRTPELNAGLFTLNDPNNLDQSSFTQELMESKGVIGSILVKTIQDEFGKSLAALDYVVYILILAAGALAFVVLYNLTNINITERIREIATIKVLGFRDKEVSAYVYRENIFLTLMGTVTGLGLGVILHRFVMGTMEIDSMMFGKIISIPSYLYSMVLTMAFAIAVNSFMYFKLKKVDMASSLKSVE